MKRSCVTRIFFLPLMAVLFSFACKKKDKNDDDDDPQPGVISVEPSKGGAVASSYKIGQVKETMLPGSLEIEGSSLRLSGDNPCADSEGFFDCQPDLLKTYTGIAKTMVEASQETMEYFAETINALEFGTGTLAINEDDVEKMDYNVKSAEEYEILLHSSSGPFLFIRVNESELPYEYYMIFNSEKAPDGEDAGASAATTISYSSEDDYTVDVVVDEMPCSDDDVKAPSSMIVSIEKTEDISAGKAMAYMPLWRVADGAPCSTTATTSTQMHMFTDFAGTDEETHGALYLWGEDVTTASELDAYPASSFCSNYASSCSSGYGFGDPNPVANYRNYFCVNEDDTAWNTSCDSVNEDDFASEWIFDIADLEVEIPSSL